MKRISFKVISLILVLVLSVSGISAYLTDSDRAENIIKIGEISINLIEPNWKDDTGIKPNQTVPKDPYVSNDGKNDAFIYLEVRVPYADVITVEPDGTLKDSDYNELFNYTVKEGWVEVGQPTVNADGTISHVYAYVGDNANELEALSPDDKTGTLFDEITFANIVEDQGYELTTQHVLINAYAIQSENVNGGITDPAEVWGIINNQLGDTEPTEKLSNILIPGPDFDATIPAAATKVAFVEDVAPAAYTFENGKLLDVSEAQDTGVVSWYDAESTTYYVSTQRSGVEALSNPNSSYMFSGKSNLKSFDFSNLDTKLANDMSYMFYKSTGLTSVDVSSFNADNVKTMEYMFGTNVNSGNPMKLTSITLGGSFDTSNVENMAYMFRNCQLITDIDTELIDTSSCKSFRAMFYRCYKFTDIDLSMWDTSKCEDMSYMFGNDYYLTNVDLSNFDTSKVVNMESMFTGCEALSGLSVAHFDTSSCEDLGFMFYGCKGLKTIDFDSWDVSKVKSFDHLMAHSNMEDYDVSEWNVTSACENLNAIFHSTRETYIDVTGWDTSNVIAFNQLCDGMWYLEKIDGLETWDTSKGVCFAEMFHGCGSLKEVNLSSFDTRNADTGTPISGNGDTSYGLQDLFSGCSGLEKLILGKNFTRFGDGTIGSGYYAYFPTPAGGYWYAESDGKAYAPADVPDLTADTYYSSKNN